jgi:hypothetical protein
MKSFPIGLKTPSKSEKIGEICEAATIDYFNWCNIYILYLGSSPVFKGFLIKILSQSCS